MGNLIQIVTIRFKLRIRLRNLIKLGSLITEFSLWSNQKFRYKSLICKAINKFYEYIINYIKTWTWVFFNDGLNKKIRNFREAKGEKSDSI